LILPRRSPARRNAIRIARERKWDMDVIYRREGVYTRSSRRLGKFIFDFSPQSCKINSEDIKKGVAV
jgi:hypothetical protein